MNLPGLDYAFLKHIGVSVEGEAALHGFYLPLLAGQHRVLDLGCGMGGMVKLLLAAGHDAYGVDSDPLSIAEARRHNLPVVEVDILDHLRSLEPASLDAILSAHVVEHLPYQAVLELMQLAHAALKPGGRLLLMTPNPRALITHLELYHLHFGHVALHHPKLLQFFMEQAGFAHITWGENPHTMPANVSGDSPLVALGQINPTLTLPYNGRELSRAEQTGTAEVLPKPSNPVRRGLWYVKIALINWLVRPFYDRTQRDLRRRDAQLQQQVEELRVALRTVVQAVDRPFECYVIGDKKMTG